MKTAWMVLMTTLMVATLPGCCCFDRCRPKLRVFDKPVAQIVQPPANWCVGNCSVDKDAYEAPAYVTPQDGVPGES
jgi:hypothetical protein